MPARRSTIGWTVMVRGIRFRAGRSILVALLAMTATASAVLATGYLRAAQESVLADGLRSAPASATGLVVAASGTDASGTPAIDQAHLAVNQAFATRPVLAGQFDRPIAAADTDTLVTGSGTDAMARLAYREGVCAHLVVTGACPASNGEVLVSERSATINHITVGKRLTVGFDPGASRRPPGVHTLRVTVVGLYTPNDPTEPYWGTNAYFANGVDPTGVTPRRTDAVFTASEQDVRTDPQAIVGTHLEMLLRPATVTTDGVPRLRQDLATFTLSVKAANLTVDSALPQVLDDVAAEQRSLRRTVPVVGVPLVLLCLFVLFLVVAALAEERGPEIALAKLRGFPTGRAARFGIAEVLLLIALAAPLGAALGAALVEVAARMLLAPGVRVEPWLPTIAAGVLTPAAGASAAWLAARRTLARPVLGLLRRVPERTGWRAGLVEIVAVVAAAASLVAAFDDRSSPLALLAAPLIALVAGLVAARLSTILARVRLRRSARRGKIVGLLAGARLARQPGRYRVIVVVTVAVALLVFGATAWDIGAAARVDRARDTLGADRVYSVIAPYPSALVAAVGAADPGENSMAVVRGRQQFAGGDVDLVGVQSLLLPKVARWRGESTDRVGALSVALHPSVAPEVLLRGVVTVTGTVTSTVDDTVHLGVLISSAGQPPRTVQLGTLAADVQVYQAVLPGCGAGCRLLGITVGRVATHGRAAAAIRITSIASGGSSITSFVDASYWQVAPDRAPAATVTATTGSALRLRVATTDPNDALVSYRDTPDSLPAVLAGPSPAADRTAGAFDFPSFADDKEPFRIVARTDRLPRVGGHGLLFDLDDAVGMAERSGTLADATGLRYEVWANAEAPTDLVQRLRRQGISVLRTESVDGYLDQLSRGAPALGLWLYLFAGALALLLAVGVVLLGAYLGAATRVYEYAALKVAGVRPAMLRRAVIREYRSTLGVALIVGVASGLAGAALMLPGVALVSVGVPLGTISYDTRMLVLPAAVATSVLAMTVVTALALRMLRRATPERLREGIG